MGVIRCFVFLLCALAVLRATVFASLREDGRKNHGKIIPDPVIQAQIEQAVHAFQQNEDDLVAFVRAVSPLMSAARERGPELVRQLIHHHSGAKDVPEGMMLFIVIDYANISKLSMVEAIAPLFGTNDPKLQNGLREVQGMIETPAIRELPNFAPYESYISVRGQETEPGLIEHLYRVSPGQAVLTLGHVFARWEDLKPILWAEHVVADTLWKQRYGFIGKQQTEAKACQQLDLLSKHDQWWVRLYVAAILRQEPEFRTEGLIERLRKDQHPLVRKTIAEVARPSK